MEENVNSAQLAGRSIDFAFVTFDLKSDKRVLVVKFNSVYSQSKRSRQFKYRQNDRILWTNLAGIFYDAC